MQTTCPRTAVTVLAIGIAFIQGCATPTVVKVKQSADISLSCDDLRKQYDEAADFEAKARKERTVTGTNVAAAVLFWPALLGTYANTEEAINAAKDRQTGLQKIADGKKCRLDQAQSETSPAPQSARPVAATNTTVSAPLSASAVAVAQPTAAPRQPEQVGLLEVQRRLLELGYQPGKPDGVMGQKTVDAIKKFQQDRNLTVTGRADSETVAKLR